MENKYQKMTKLMEKDAWDYVPAAFFCHFDKEFHTGTPAVEKHEEYFAYTDMDFIKIQFEKQFPSINIDSEKDFERISELNIDFRGELTIIRELAKNNKKQALIIQTIYSPYSCLAATTSYDLITEYLNKNSPYVKAALSWYNQLVKQFVLDCIAAGVDGFYYSTQGGESGRFADPQTFLDAIKPVDLDILSTMTEKSAFTILHICDYWLAYDSLDPFMDYPCDALSYPFQLKDNSIVDMHELYERTGKIIFGGLDRKKAIKTGPTEAISSEVQAVLANKPKKFILGADCTVADCNWDYVRHAIALAHAYKA